MPRIYLQTQNEHTFQVVSLQAENTSFMNTDIGGKFIVNINNQHYLRVFNRDKEVAIIGIDDIEFSFEIGYQNYTMACVTYAKVPPEERNTLGRDQLLVNNNWRITTGTEEYALNLPVERVNLGEERNPLFRVLLDHRLPEPHRISIRIRPGHFATLFFISSFLTEVRFNGDYITQIYRRIQRTAVIDPNEGRVVPSNPFNDVRFARIFELFQNRRMQAIEASPERMNRFRSFLNRALNELIPERGIRHLINEDNNEELVRLRAMLPNHDQNLNEFYGQRR